MKFVLIWGTLIAACAILAFWLKSMVFAVLVVLCIALFVLGLITGGLRGNG